MRQPSALVLAAALTFAVSAAGQAAQDKPGAAAADAPPCDKAVRFSAAWFPEPELDTSKSAAELAQMDAQREAKTDAKKEGKKKSGGLPLGHVVVETRLTVVPQTTCRGVLVRLDYSKPMLRIAKEMPPGSCAYARVLNHEHTHVRIHREIAEQFRALEYPWGHSGNNKAILTFAKQELDRLMQAQVQFDSPEEYARNHTLCNGEIGRLVKSAAAAAR